MPSTCVIGLLWGDEGKGKIIDLLAADAEWVVRYGGGHNAGHTLIHEGQRLVLHLVPSAILRRGAKNLIGNGVVVDPYHLRSEIAGLGDRGVEVRLGDNLLLDQGAHVILPVHRTLDGLSETARGSAKLGTTGRGIGPAYADRAARCGIRVGDLIRPARLDAALARFCAEKNAILSACGVAPFDAEQLRAELLELGEFLRPGIVDGGRLLRAAWREGARVLFEGAQGVLLDVDHGTYPFVTSSSASSGGVAAGTGLPPQAIERVVGVMKAYATRVGSGPFPSELFGDFADRLRQAGREFGSTTGRPRRIGWFDAVAARHAAQVCGATELVMTNLDVLAGMGPIRVVTAYRLAASAGGETVEHFPTFDLDGLEPTHREYAGFDEDLSSVRRFADLPLNARSYVEAVEALVGVPIRTISVGPGRDQVIRRSV